MVGAVPSLLVCLHGAEGPATLWGAEKGGQTVPGVHVSSPNSSDHFLWDHFSMLI